MMSIKPRVMIIMFLQITLLFAVNSTVLGEQRVDSNATIKRVLILGNSITRHAPAPNIGWYGDWGMAASSKDKDFVHILQAKFRQVSPSVTVDFENIASFERTFWEYDLSKFDSLLALHPDLIILRIGENVKAEWIEKHNFKLCYEGLIDYFRKKDNKIKVLCVSSFWKTDKIDQITESASNSRNCSYLKISQLSDDPANMALGKFEHEGVAKHPSDKGMAAIADLIWQKISSLQELK
ncbi:SGNH/GDSL hydrolase family protein [Segetibacter sp.]|uniref:SGNH/GDSL hydrolase family protein n=1 Tax=Segetibacter sp. TaxID=2231182 RepID=UPI002634F573|nr:SGNH/GDSL hydrolase family protein [Segetibacter sp.]